MMGYLLIAKGHDDPQQPNGWDQVAQEGVGGYS